MPRQVAAAAVVFALALAALLAVRSSAELHPPFPKAKAVAAARADRGIAAYLERTSWTRTTVIALDRVSWRVSFWDGPRLVLDVALGPGGRVEASQEHPPSSHQAGSTTLWTPALLILLAALFFLAVAASPLRSLRNLDALVVAAGFTLSALLADARLVAAHVYVGLAALGYVAVRCAEAGFGRTAVAPADPLHRRLLPAAAERVIAMLTGAALAAGLLLVVTSTNPSDVAFANLLGATQLTDGTVPYGHLGGLVFHGDTYPILSYALYVPSALVAPVRDSFDSLDGGLWLNAVALAAGALLLHRGSGRAHTLAWLTFPPVLIAASGGRNDVPAAVFVIAALVTFGRPLASVALLTLAGWVKIVPAVALLPWLARLRGRSLATACVVAVAVSAAALLLVVAIGGGGALGDAWEGMRFQFVRGSWYSLWQQLGLGWLQPVFQAATLAFAAAVAVHVWQRGAARIGLRQAAGLAGALVALLQLGANYWTYAYLPWLLPFILVALFPSEPRRSPPPAPPVP